MKKADRMVIVKKSKFKRVKFEKRFVAVVSLLNLIASAVRYIADRKAVVKALQNPEKYRTIVVKEQTTEIKGDR
ncbi:MAG: hypothetical protein Q4C42_07500 [Clostridia bacterium]|nr:hypothetical protein [Clostridia bacterium]